MRPSMSWHRRAQDCIAQNALTNSKRPECFVFGEYPTHLKGGSGGVVVDHENKNYIDFICGLGSNLLGYAYPPVVHAAWMAMKGGATLSLSSCSEILFAEELKGHFPFIDKIKILKSGSEAASAAVRIARAYTGKSVILSDGYHGWHDIFVSLTPPALGIKDEFNIGTISDLSWTQSKSLAAIIIEPVSTDISEERRLYLQELREFCTIKGILLIFDEIITGFRFPKFSVSNYWGIYPDLILLGKAMANGLPISVVGGKKEIMEAGKEEGGYFVSSTFAGERPSLEASRVVMRELSSKRILETIWERGREFLEKFNAIAPEIVRIEGYPTRGVLKGNEGHIALFFQESIRAGILFGPSWFFCLGHIDLIDQVISTSKDILTRIKNNEVQLTGDMPVKAFAQKMRE